MRNAISRFAVAGDANADADDADQLRLWTPWKNVRSKGINHCEFIINQIQFCLAASATPTPNKRPLLGRLLILLLLLVCICLA